MSTAARGSLKKSVRSALQRPIVRYVLVGSAGASTYLLISNAAHALGAPVWLSSGGARVLSQVVAFNGHAFFTFKLATFDAGNVVRFLILWIMNILYVIVFSSIVVDGLGAEYWIASVGVVVTTPIINYNIQKHWVFRAKSDAGNPGQ